MGIRNTYVFTKTHLIAMHFKCMAIFWHAKIKISDQNGQSCCN